MVAAWEDAVVNSRFRLMIHGILPRREEASDRRAFFAALCALTAVIFARSADRDGFVSARTVDVLRALPLFCFRNESDPLHRLI